MKKLEVFDPPLCCSTGACGPNVDPALVRFASDLHWLADQQIVIERYNLAQQPHAFVQNDAVKTALQKCGDDCLPLLLLDGAIISTGRYPSRDELAQLLGVKPDQSSTGRRSPKLPVIKTGCC